MSTSINWAPIKTSLIALAGAALPIIGHAIQTNSLPTTWAGWLQVLISAAGAAGLYHVPSPSAQPGAQGVVGTPSPVKP
jgi:hypothetical protein